MIPPPLNGSISDSSITVTFNGTDTNMIYYNTTLNLNVGDNVHVYVSYTGGNVNLAHDLTVQLDLF